RHRVEYAVFSTRVKNSSFQGQPQMPTGYAVGVAALFLPMNWKNRCDPSWVCATASPTAPSSHMLKPHTLSMFYGKAQSDLNGQRMQGHQLRKNSNPTATAHAHTTRHLASRRTTSAAHRQQTAQRTVAGRHDRE